MNPEQNPPETEKEEELLPPFMKSWKNLYILVIGNLVFLIIIFYLLTKIYS